MGDIKIGWQVGMKHLPLEKSMAWAKTQKIETVELGAWPDDPYLKVDKILAGSKADLVDPIRNNGIEIETLAYCVNHLDSNDEAREKKNAHMIKVIDAAHSLDVDIIACFVGNAGGNLYQNIAAVEEFFIPLLEYAKDHNIKMAIENCPGSNIATNPGIWDLLFFEVCEEFDNFGLEFDPSHLVRLKVDYMAALKEFAEKGKIFCCHAKDTKLDESKLARYGLDSLQERWWEYKIPGLGVVDWKGFMDVLKASGFKGAVQVEHEDGEYSGSKYQEGLVLGLDTLYKALGN
jgi:sugar phosphate isomerase/epimerase